MKNFLIILSTLIVFFGLSIYLYSILGKHIYNRKDCERFNIDHVELRTGMDILELTDCYCQLTENGKIMHINPDTSKYSMTDFLIKNNFTLENNIYITKGKNIDTKWIAKYFKDKNELEIQLKYLD